MRKILLTLVVCIEAFGQSTQPGIPWRASVTATVNASASYTFTVQQNGSNIQNIQSAVVSCGSNTFTVSQYQNGTAATTTALNQTTSGTISSSANALMVLSPYALQTPLSLTAWTASNVGTGTAISGAQPYSSTAVIGPIPGRQYLAVFSSTSTSQNYSLLITNTGGSSCSLVIDIYGIQLL
jgi:hypothetical protein